MLSMGIMQDFHTALDYYCWQINHVFFKTKGGGGSSRDLWMGNHSRFLHASLSGNFRRRSQINPLSNNCKETSIGPQTVHGGFLKVSLDVWHFWISEGLLSGAPLKRKPLL